MKRSYCKVLLFLFIMMIGFLINQFAPVQAADSFIKVYLEDQQLTFPVQPQIVDGRTMVPLRTIFEAMGAVLEWDGGTMTATAVKDSTTVVIQIGNKSATINGQKQTLDVPPMVIEGSTLAPLAFVARAFGDYVRWDGTTKTIYISATAFPPETAETGSDQTNMTGSASGNITVNNGYICLQGDWIYFMNWRDCSFLYRIKTDGSGLQQISDETIWGDINVVGDWVYYNTSHSLMRVRTDGSNRQKLSDDTPNWLTVVGDWAYYSTNTNDPALYRIRTDGSSKQRLTSELCNFINVSGDWIYYSGNELYRIRTNGSDRQLVSDVNNPFVVDGEWIYYYKSGGRGETHGSICRIKTDGSSEQKVTDDFAGFWNVANGWFYYNKADELNQFYRIRTDGTGREKFCRDASSELYLFGDWLYFYYDTDICRIKLDGTCRQVLSISH